MRQSWIRVSALIAKDARLVALPSDAARFAWIVVLGEGKFTDTPGKWEGEAHFKASLGARSRWLEDFVGAGLIEKADDGALRVKAWQKWQTDPTAAKRKKVWERTQSDE